MGLSIFKTPDVGEGTTEVELICWHIAVGDEVTQDQPIADVMTDKANVELSSPVTGRVVRLGCGPEEMIAVGAELVCFDVGDEAGDDVAAIEPEAPTPASTQAQQSESVSEKPSSGEESIPALPPRRAKALASPAVRRHAHELGIDITRIRGSGPKGRVCHGDLDQSGSTSAPGVAASQSDGATEQIKVTGLRRVIAEKMAAAKRTIPHFSYVEEVDMTSLEALRAHLNKERLEGRPKLTLLPFLMEAMVQALARFPEINATYDDEARVISRYKEVHIGIATMTDQGLKVPVVKDAGDLDIWSKATQLKRVAEAARDNSAGIDELSGSTITITSLGKLGGIVSTPVVNRPEVAIIGVNKVQERVVVHDGEMVIRTMMNLSSSFDHRIVDGHLAAEFIQYIKGLLEHPASLFVPQ